jgi:hypothetical protein
VLIDDERNQSQVRRYIGTLVRSSRRNTCGVGWEQRSKNTGTNKGSRNSQAVQGRACDGEKKPFTVKTKNENSLEEIVDDEICWSNDVLKYTGTNEQ